MLAPRSPERISSRTGTSTVLSSREKTGTWCSPCSPRTDGEPLIFLSRSAMPNRALSSWPPNPMQRSRGHAGRFPEIIIIDVHRVRDRDEDAGKSFQQPCAVPCGRQVGTRAGRHGSLTEGFRGSPAEKTQMSAVRISCLVRADRDVKAGVLEIEHLRPAGSRVHCHRGPVRLQCPRTPQGTQPRRRSSNPHYCKARHLVPIWVC